MKVRSLVATLLLCGCLGACKTEDPLVIHVFYDLDGTFAKSGLSSKMWEFNNSGYKSNGKWKLFVASVVLTCFWWVTEQNSALSDSGSSLSLHMSSVVERVGRAPGRNSFEVLHKMNSYCQRGMYDSAIRAGISWTDAHPIDGFNDKVFIAISQIFLKRAQSYPAHNLEHVRSALKYRDKAVPIASDQELGWYSMNTVKELAVISETAGDLSSEERCVQYRNSVRLRKALKARLQDKREEIGRRIVPEPEDLTTADVQCLSDQNDEGIRLIEEKEVKLSCR